VNKIALMTAAVLLAMATHADAGECGRMICGSNSPPATKLKSARHGRHDATAEIVPPSTAKEVQIIPGT